MPRKGSALVKTPNKEDKYKIADSGGEEVTSNTDIGDSNNNNSSCSFNLDGRLDHVEFNGNKLEAVSVRVKIREPLRQPRQAPEIVGQGQTLVNALFPPNHPDDKITSAPAVSETPPNTPPPTIKI
ncbi:hypothetical protein J1614_000336 [Plenodomus biglobosus]|nr:hypothetical protein J1614_000336 [Plenodomus biglobosus]